MRRGGKRPKMDGKRGIEVRFTGRYGLMGRKIRVENEVVATFLREKFCGMEKSLYFCSRF